MINSNKKPYLVMKNEKTQDALGQVSSLFIPFGTVEVSVFLQQQRQNETDIRYINATHIGLTTNKSIEVGYKLEGEATYEVLLVNNEGRLAQLTLKEVK